MSREDQAILYAERGWPVFPLRFGGKAPATPHGFKDATTDPEEIRDWWACGDWNIGLATGHAFDVLDVDKIGYSELSGDLLGLVGRGPCVATPGGGFHAYVQPTGLGNRARFVAGTDWRGMGGYVVAPPSRDGRGMWEWIGDHDEVPPCPGWLRGLLDKPLVPHGGGDEAAISIRDSSKWGQGALRRAVAVIETAPEGTRNTTLSRRAWSLTELVAQGHIALEDLYDCLGNAALRAGLEFNEVQATLDSAVRGSRWL